MSRPVLKRSEQASRPTLLNNLRILPSMHQRFLERDTSDSQELFNGEQSPCTPTDSLNVVFKSNICPPTPTKTPTNLKTKSLKKKAKVAPFPSPLFQSKILDENGMLTVASPVKKPSPAAKRKFAKFHQSLGQSPHQHEQQHHHYHDHLRSSSPKVPVTPGRPQSAKSRRLFSEDPNHTEPIRSPVEEEVEEEDDDQIEDEDEDEDEIFYENNTNAFDNKMDLSSDMATPPSNPPSIFTSPELFNTPVVDPSPRNHLSSKKVVGTSSPNMNKKANIINSPILFGDDDVTPVTNGRHLAFEDSDDEIEEEEKATSQTTSDRDVDEFDLHMESQNSQMASCTPPRFTQTLEEDTVTSNISPNTHLIPFRLTDSDVHQNPFSPERNVRSVLAHSARKSGRTLQIPKTPSLSASPRKSPKNSANKTTVLSNASDLISAGEEVNLYFSRYAEDFQEEAVLGDGSFGKVTKCRHKIDGTLYAVKRLKNQIRGKKDLDNTLKEVQALATLVDNPHIVRYFAAWVEDERLHVQTELCAGGSLANEIKSRRRFTENELISLLRQIACGLEQMHSQGIVHLDIKPENIYITTPGKYKIGDLGLASSSLKEYKDVQEGDSRYLCRELLNGDTFVGSTNTDLTKADIFALGVTIYETATQIDLPNNGDDWHALRDGNLKHLQDGSYNPGFVSLLKSMMHPDPSKRPAALTILQSSYMQQMKPDYEELEKQNRILEIMLKRQQDREEILAQQLLLLQQKLQAATSGF